MVEFVETTGARRLERLARNGGKRDHNSGEADVVGTSSVQRYIETLRVAGEWIEYDISHKGWTLQEGKSILWGDF